MPIDDDVRPFSVLNPVGRDTDRNNRRHHFISAVYLDSFADEHGWVQVYRSEVPEYPHHMKPRAIGFERDYYSQKLPKGGQESHRFEDLWNTIETVWPEAVRALAVRRLSPAISFNVLGMQTIMRARVQATRDRHALMLEAKLRTEYKVAEEIGQLPPELEDYVCQSDTVPIGINPHETLLAMQQEFKDFGDLCFRFDPDRNTLLELTTHYQRGGLGDTAVKRRLETVLHDLLAPIRIAAPPGQNVRTTSATSCSTAHAAPAPSRNQR